MKVWLSAGEVSGDRLGALLATELRGIDPGIRLAGLAGPRMRDAGVVPHGDALLFAHAGWSSVARHLPSLVLGAMRSLRAVRDFQPDLFVAIDSPGLNRFLLRRMRSRGIRTAWLAPPQLWAWRDRVVPELSGMDAYPLHAFEGAALERSGAQVHWFGFPGPRPEASPSGPSGRTLALLPGSRSFWRARHEPLFREAAGLAGLPLDPVVAIPEGRVPGVGEAPVDDVLHHAALALALPGTGVLESALRGVPTLVAAHPGRFDRWLVRDRITAGALSLPNRILGDMVLPENVGTPSACELADELVRLWERREDVRIRLAALSVAMGPSDGMARIARHLLETQLSTECA